MKLLVHRKKYATMIKDRKPYMPMKISNIIYRTLLMR